MESNYYGLIGSSGVGKSTVARKVVELLPMRLIDVDEEFRSRFGDIGKYGEKFGWRAYFEKQSQTIKGIFQHIIKAEVPALIVLPSSALLHYDYIEICKENRKVIFEHAILICLIAHKDLLEGMKLSVERQTKRPYDVDAELKGSQYIYQTEYYTQVADYVVINDRTPYDAAQEIKEYILKKKNHV